jgi:hypothetical protein
MLTVIHQDFAIILNAPEQESAEYAIDVFPAGIRRQRSENIQEAAMVGRAGAGNWRACVRVTATLAMLKDS